MTFPTSRHHGRTLSELLAEDGPLRRITAWFGSGWVLLECGHDIYRPAAYWTGHKRTRCPACRDGVEAPEGQQHRAFGKVEEI